VLAARQKRPEAIAELERILAQEPDHAGARAGLEKLRGAAGS
jgi:hypothetical protein